MKKSIMWMAVCAVSIITGLLLTDLAMTMKLSNEIKELKPEPQQHKSIPCESVPLRWVVEHYDCANSLVLAMNITNVKFMPPGTSVLSRYNISVPTKKPNLTIGVP